MKDPTALLSDARMAFRYAAGLRTYLRTPLPERCPDPAELSEESRGRRFLEVVERCVLPDPSNPYARLLAHAGVEMGDLRKLVDADGLEPTLTRLMEAGVYLRMDEFKGRKPVERPGLSFQVEPRQFDNPWADPVYAAQTSGTTGRSRRVLIGFDHMTYEAGYHRQFRSAHRVEGMPYVMWRPAPPGSAGLSNALSASKLGVPVDRWFSQNPVKPSPSTLREYLFTHYSLAATRLWGAPAPSPEHASVAGAGLVANHLSACVARGRPALFNAPVSSAVRVCVAAREAGLDLAGTAFRTGGEPLTAVKARVIHAAGGSTMPHYAMAEIGLIGIPCPHPAGSDDVHLLTDKLAVIPRPETLAGEPVNALVVTTLRTTTPVVMINVDTGDCASIDPSPCGCPIGSFGYSTRLSSVLSYEKLTGEGMNFLHGDVIALVDEVLPSRFGGNPTDYQLLESDTGGISKVSVVVSPRLGEMAEDRVREVVLAALSAGPSYRSMMGGIWEDAGTIEVLRREPYANSAGKVQALHFIR